MKESYTDTELVIVEKKVKYIFSDKSDFRMKIKTSYFDKNTECLLFEKTELTNDVNKVIEIKKLIASKSLEIMKNTNGRIYIPTNIPHYTSIDEDILEDEIKLKKIIYTDDEIKKIEASIDKIDASTKLDEIISKDELF